MAASSICAQAVVALDIGLAARWRRLRACGASIGGGRVGLAVDQPVQEVQDMGLGRHAGLQRQLDGAEHGLFVVLQDQGEDLDHLPVAAGRLSSMCSCSCLKASGSSAKGAPLRRAPGLRWMTAR